MRKLLTMLTVPALLFLGWAGPMPGQSKSTIDIKDLKGAATALKSTSSADRAAGLSFIALLGPEAKSQTREVVGFLFDSSPDVRDWAKKALPKVDPALSGPVMALVQNQDPAQQLKALEQLGKMAEAGGAAVPALLVYFEKAKGAERTAAASVLGQIGTKDPAVASVLANIAMKDPDPKVRQIALTALPKQENQQGAVEAFSAMLNNADPANRTTAIAALGAIAGKNQQAMAVLQKVMQSDPSPAVKTAAAQAVENAKKK
jgi:hypothetical protein